MNKPTLSAVPDENKIEELLTRLQPVPSEHFHQKMKQATWRMKDGKSVIVKNFRSKIALAVITLAILSILLITPPGRAWAQEVFQFFQKVDVNTIPLSQKELEWYNDFNTAKESYALPLVPVIIPTPVPEMASLPGCDNAEKAQSYACQVAYAESQLGFELMEFPVKPQGLEFQSVWFNEKTKTATIEFEYGEYGRSLRLTQRLGSAPEQPGGRWSWVPAGDVEKIQVGTFDGEYVSGFFDLPAGSSELVWNDTTIAQRVAWSDGTNWYLLESSMGNSGFIKRDQLIALAASLVKAPVMVDKQPDPDALDATLSSISEAEAYSGLDLKAPTLLPMGFEFSYARYSSLRNNEVYLRYDGNNTGSSGYMIIYEREENSISFDSLSTTQGNTQGNYEIVKINDQNAFYGFIEEGQSPHRFLWWRDGNLTYQMYFYWYNDSIHGVINKQKMIAIAESMEDINVFKGRTPKPYESVKIYEEALNIDILEFSTIPVGWSFYGFWAEAWDKCIGLAYTLTTVQGRLYLTECGTDRLFEISDIPATAIERVKVGKNKAQYITGAFGYDSNGKLVWQPDLPVRQLRWQESGLWIQMTISGESTVLLDKEDLISLAESLR
jgi:hypothetical protein